MGFLDKFKKKSELKEYPNEYPPEMRDVTRKGAELMEKNPKLSMEEISKLSKISPLKNDHLTQDLVNSDEFRCRQMALSYSMAGNLDECIDYCNKGLEINPNSPYLLYMRGRTFSDLKQFEKGITDLANAVELRDDFADAWYEIGRIHQMNNDMDNAILAYHKSQQLEPNYYKIYVDEPDVKGEIPKITQTLNEQGVEIVINYLSNTPDEIDCTLTGYFAICCEHKLLPEYLFPPYNIRIIISCQSNEMVRNWTKQLSQLLNENGLHTKFMDKGHVLQIMTFNEKLQEFVPAVIISREA